ncbi:MAG: 4-alpha-glucanotransferase [Treponema sp.]|nr:4-alpha-glucanotransferase [Treponema sp.]
MNSLRSAGILLHPTSLADSPGIGTLGKAAFSFVDFLKKARLSLWQVLPLGPTGYGDSPYQSFSTFALNPLLIDLPLLAEKGWIDAASAVPPSYISASGPVDYGAVVWWKMPVLKAGAAFFLENAASAAREAFGQFCAENAFWLEDYASFMSIKGYYDAKAAEEAERTKSAVAGSWNVYWEKGLARHEEGAVAAWNASHQQDVEAFKVIQFFAFCQWKALKRYANENGISIIGDIPIFVAPDSADVWANQRLFQLDKNGVPKAVAGVPPDYFSATGQLWGNPLYDWKAMKKDGYSWWISRITQMLTLTDFVRIDHFRGFEAYWSIPYGSATAVTGEWKKGPGRALFDAIRASLGELPLIAEDLGVITDEVRSLRDGAGLPGMKILQFAFDTAEYAGGNLVNAFLPHTYSKNCVVYTGSHDNDTTQGWLQSLPGEQLALVASYVTGKACSQEDAAGMMRSGSLCAALVRLALSSVAQFAVIPMQDLYALSSEARMNTPSTSGRNWCWRMEHDMLIGARADACAEALACMTTLYGRAE